MPFSVDYCHDVYCESIWYYVDQPQLDVAARLAESVIVINLFVDEFLNPDVDENIVFYEWHCPKNIMMHQPSIQAGSV